LQWPVPADLSAPHKILVTQLQGDHIAVNLVDPAKEAAGGYDIIPLLERLQKLTLQLLLLGLRAEQEKPEYQNHGAKK